MLNWTKKGQIFDPTKGYNLPWMNDFAQCTSTLIGKDYVRVYFSCRPPKDENGQFVSYTTFADFDRQDLTKILRIANQPILELGDLGTFDEFGIYPTCVIPYQDQFYLYYAGWTRLQSTFANVSIGLAISNDGEVFKRVGKGPILTRSVHEPFQLSGPKVRFFNGMFFMYYIAGERWLKHKNQTETIYKIRMATSNDGLHWKKHHQSIINPILEADECQAGPDVFFYESKYHMYFSYRYGLDFRNNDRGYRIGYAYSHDLFNWTRDDNNVGIKLSEKGWDSQDMHYPHVFQLDDKWYMLYNGNHFGKYGFGLAELNE